MGYTRALLKQFVPERYRLLRYELFEKARYYPELIGSLGRRLQCPFCRWRFRRFRPAGFDFPVLKEKRVIGATPHNDDVCPRCNSNARERLAYLFLKCEGSVFSDQLSVLHVAPEPNLSRLLKSRTNLRYVTGDLFEPRLSVRLDVTTLPFEDSTFGVVICNHVLEHVPDDRRAMSEFLRVLRPGGWALLQVPIALALDHTIEDPEAQSDEDRIRLFGQRDHVRLYSEGDYIDRLSSSGFKVKVHEHSICADRDADSSYALIADEKIFVGYKV